MTRVCVGARDICWIISLLGSLHIELTVAAAEKVLRNRQDIAEENARQSSWVSKQK